MKATISLITRGRPDLLIPTIEKTLANIRDPGTTLLVAVDDDDRATMTAINERRTLSDHMWISFKPREDTLGAKWNRALTEAPADLYIIMVDYAPHLTPGFDQHYLAAADRFPDGIGVVQNQLAGNLSFSSSQAITAKLAERMGFIFPPYFPYWFIDHWVDDMASLIGRRAYVEAEVDNSRRPGTRELREPGFWASYFDALWPEKLACALGIVNDEAFIEPEWRKHLLRTSHPLVEYRSKMINEHCRQHNDIMERGYGAGPADARYLRVKRAAVEKLREIGIGRAA